MYIQALWKDWKERGSLLDTVVSSVADAGSPSLMEGCVMGKDRKGKAFLSYSLCILQLLKNKTIDSGIFTQA